MAHQLDVVVTRYRDDREFLRKSLGIIIFLLALHVVIFVLVLRSQFKRPGVSSDYIQIVRQSQAFLDADAYIKKLVKGESSKLTAQEISVSHFFSPTRRSAVRRNASQPLPAVPTYRVSFCGCFDREEKVDVVVRELIANRLHRLEKRGRNKVGRCLKWWRNARIVSTSRGSPAWWPKLPPP